MSTSEDFIGQNALTTYLSDNNRTTKSYWRFLKNHRDIIIASIDTTSTLDNWKYLDNLWTVRFLRNEKDFSDLKNKVIAERFRYAKTLKIFWQEIIKEYKENNVSTEENNEKENIVLADSSYSQKIIENSDNNHFISIKNQSISNSSHSKKNIEIPIKNHSISTAENLSKNSQLINFFKQKGNLKRTRNNDTDSSSELITKQIRILEQNKDKLVYRQVVNDALLIASAYENLITNNILPFIELLKTFLLTRSQISLSSANEPVLQAIVENLLPLKYRIPELSLVMD
ncbi:hypothetical protein RhiirA4_453936, partial [Rhizophagus irregularis]